MRTGVDGGTRTRTLVKEANFKSAAATDFATSTIFWLSTIYRFDSGSGGQ